jgi:uncharacterized protein (TIGR00661 family)
MARILYGVQGEGRGHSSRSRIVIEHLIARGHQVKILTSHKGYDYLSRHFDDVVRVMGLGFVFAGDRIDILKTLQKNIQDSSTEAGQTLKLLVRILREFKPHVAITDFEPFAPYVKTLDNLPFLSIDHQHVLSQYRLEFPHAWRQDFRSARAVVDAMYQLADHYYVTSFYFPEIKERYRGRSTLVGPILRKEVLEQKAGDEGHIVVYATTSEARLAIELARGTGHRFLAYGFNRDEEDGNILFKPPSTSGFLSDIATARAVITNGGYTLMSEALYLGKPIYSIPIASQFEQMINGYYLEKLGYGLHDLSPTAERLAMFLDGLDYFQRNIARHAERFCSNQSLLPELDGRIAAMV